MTHYMLTGNAVLNLQSSLPIQGSIEFGLRTTETAKMTRMIHPHVEHIKIINGLICVMYSDVQQTGLWAAHSIDIVAISVVHFNRVWPIISLKLIRNDTQNEIFVGIACAHMQVHTYMYILRHNGPFILHLAVHFI